MCVRIRHLPFKRLVRTYTAPWFLQRLGDSVFRIRQFVRHIDDLILRFVDLSNVCVTVVIDGKEDPSEGCDIQVSFVNNLYVLIGPSCGSVFWVLSRSYFDVLHVIHRPTLTSDPLLLSNTITRCSNNTVHYDLSLYS